ncbi:hypothetical protein CVT26_000721 [Gymnopilus dilepis]|uniref:Uncharacterized protein n=1 Tax=Gymnopilus dilepis TaxID=231916 RepID=A0A409Y2F2_9AGAR|nr:hypothetical protein CVT26_000721 [Gymnopilus dilepis]
MADGSGLHPQLGRPYVTVPLALSSSRHSGFGSEVEVNWRDFSNPPWFASAFNVLERELDDFWLKWDDSSIGLFWQTNCLLASEPAY